MARTSKPHRFPRTMPWWRSRVIVGGLIAGLAAILRQAGHAIAPEAVAAWTDIAMTITGIIGAAVAVHGRIDQETAPTITVGTKP